MADKDDLIFNIGQLQVMFRTMYNLSWENGSRIYVGDDDGIYIINSHGQQVLIGHYGLLQDGCRISRHDWGVRLIDGVIELNTLHRKLELALSVADERA